MLPGWADVRALVERGLGEAVSAGQPLTQARPALTWAASAAVAGPVVVKVRAADEGRAAGKAAFCAAQLPVLGARGYPVPVILWQGPLGAGWYVTVQGRLPGAPLSSLDGPLLEAVLDLVERQADAGIPAGERDFTGYIANVLFDDWDDEWADAPKACAAAGPLVERVRRWLEPAWGLRLPAVDYAHHDLNLSNLLSDGTRITGVVDWDEFGLGSRALDLVVLALDCQRAGDVAAAGRLLARARLVAGEYGLRCLVGYRAIAALAHSARYGAGYDDGLADQECAAVSAVLDRSG
jgi:aminoglycoside phosphotransferase (APT) family kinase protein